MVRTSSAVSKFLTATLLIIGHVAATTYKLDTSYSGTTFFDGFSFFTQPDYSHGFVTYLDKASATKAKLIRTNPNGSVYIGVDSTTVLSPTGPGRNSVRITSLKSWTHGLVILDLAHMPGTDCGSWPAFWMVGPNWPSGGEIDIIEGVNSNTLNLISLHTNDNCSLSGLSELGTLTNPNCAESQSYGCSVLTSTPTSYGTPFNLANGGIYATEWTSSYIRIYFFPRNHIPPDILAGMPNPASWGLPQANMQGNCNIDQHFHQHQIVFDITFCGDWAGSVWGTDPVCGGKDSCEGFVAGNPKAFGDAFWLVNWLKVFTSLGGGVGPTSNSRGGSTSSRTTTSSLKSTQVKANPVSSTSSVKIMSIKTTSTTSKTTTTSSSSRSFSSKTSSPTTSKTAVPTSSTQPTSPSAFFPFGISLGFTLKKTPIRREIGRRAVWNEASSSASPTVVPARSVGHVVASSSTRGVNEGSKSKSTVVVVESTVLSISKSESVSTASSSVSVKSGGERIGVDSCAFGIVVMGGLVACWL